MHRFFAVVLIGILTGCAVGSETTLSEFPDEQESYPLPAKPAPGPVPVNPPEDPILPPGEVNPPPKSPNARNLTVHCHPDVPGNCL